MDILDEIDGRTLVDSSLTTDDSVSGDSEVLSVLVEEDDDVLLGREVGGDEYGEVRFISCCTKGKTDILKAETGEAFVDFSADCFWEMLDGYLKDGELAYHSWTLDERSCSGHSW